MARKISPPDETRYLTAILPKEGPSLSLYIDKYRALRLQALEDSPDGLAGSAEIERSLPRSYFVDLVTDSNRHTIVIVERPSSNSNSDETLVNGTWVGLAHVLGPCPLSEWKWPNIGNLRSDLEETRWRAFNGYVVPEHRGRNTRMLRRIEDKVVELCAGETRRLLAPRAKQEGRENLYIRQRTCVTEKTRGLLRTYSKVGWCKAGYITAEESLKSIDPGYEYGSGQETKMESLADDIPDRMVLERVLRVSTTEADGEVKIMSKM